MPIISSVLLFPLGIDRNAQQLRGGLAYPGHYNS